MGCGSSSQVENVAPAPKAAAEVARPATTANGRPVTVRHTDRDYFCVYIFSDEVNHLSTTTFSARFLSRRQSGHCDDYGRAERRLHYYTITTAGLVSARYRIASVAMPLHFCCRVSPSGPTHTTP
ncbi:hypothetical protein ANCDUO_07959 [Ancylostoma duodenale]|uniref:Uncharacterized protein n=1 Tax=Ancylostoma duodenale TaxID=51022 RepID=A0A0C2GXA3_9BILA|nr:hypothetical protein ANCDUO_07959 [Ancylostoma duodenale]